jgi:uncharacterized membrane protein YeaQ/YmgE (transglycosylase-associated protein family)
MVIFAWIVVGLIAGWLAKLAVPGPEPGGFIATVLIGIVGACVGGWIWNLMGSDPTLHINLGSIFIAFVGSVVFLVIWKALTGGRSRAV